MPELRKGKASCGGVRLAIASDIHYASAAEKVRGNDYEYRDLRNPVLRNLIRFHRRYLWLRDPLEHNELLDRFLEHVGQADLLITLGDYSCDSAFVGLSDEASMASARECLGKLRAGGRGVLPVMGDHELGKFGLVGKRGGLRLASWERAEQELGIKGFSKKEIGRYVIVAVSSTLVALPTFAEEMLSSEQERWQALREQHLLQVRAVFEELKPDQRVLLLCHDPTALPFLWAEASVRRRINQIEQTLIGHLHSPLILWESRVLAGMPRIRFLGHSIQRLSTALNQARFWRPFRVRLCPSLAGIELLKDGGFYLVHVTPDASEPLRFSFQKLLRTQVKAV